uniref:Uncharacterized protein n=1 Tax=Arundo donax TaxID=35708 RepID=A0A0A8ZJ34_ARUDO
MEHIGSPRSLKHFRLSGLNSTLHKRF